jgi:hypothetical protein
MRPSGFASDGLLRLVGRVLDRFRARNTVAREPPRSGFVVRRHLGVKFDVLACPA